MEDKQPLTLKALCEIAKAQIENSPYSEECIVCIPNNKGGMGGTSVTNVNGAGCGIDWDARKFFMWPENKMIEYGQEPIKDWRAHATEWAVKQMPKGWRIDNASAEEVDSFYNWVLMFIRDCYSIFQKQI